MIEVARETEFGADLLVREPLPLASENCMALVYRQGAKGLGQANDRVRRRSDLRGYLVAFLEITGYLYSISTE